MMVDLLLCLLQSVHEGRIYQLKLFCDKDYPEKPPSVRFYSRINMTCVNHETGVVTNCNPLSLNVGVHASFFAVWIIQPEHGTRYSHYWLCAPLNLVAWNGQWSWLLTSNWVTSQCISYSTLVLWSCFSDWWANEWTKYGCKERLCIKIIPSIWYLESSSVGPHLQPGPWNYGDMD